MKKKLLIEGMSCGHCTMHVKNAINELKGVKDVDVDLASKTAVVIADGEISDSDLKLAVEDAGYQVIAIDAVNS